MPDGPDRSGAPAGPPDFFARLLARHTSLAPPTGAVTRVRPRLPGPFERIEALRAEPPGPDEPALLLPPATPHPPPREAPPAGPEREIRTERQTVIRTEPAEDTGRGAHARPAAPPPARRRAAPPPAPQRSPAPRPRGAEAVAGRPADPPPDTPAGREPAPPYGPARAGAPRLTAPSPARPRPADAAVARQGQAPAGRRATGSAEPAVHIQIGRLEVRAAGPAGAAAPPRRGGRRTPRVSLDDYLSRRSNGADAETARDPGHPGQ